MKKLKPKSDIILSGGGYMSLDQRVSHLENKVETLTVNMAEVKVQLSHLATKAGLIEAKGDLETKIEKSRNSIVVWLVSIAIAMGLANHFIPPHNYNDVIKTIAQQD